MIDTGHCVSENSLFVVQRLQSEEVSVINVSLDHGHHRFVIIVRRELAWLPWRDDTVIGSTNQHQFSQTKEIHFELCTVGRLFDIVDERKVSRVSYILIGVVWIFPVICHRPPLTWRWIKYSMYCFFDQIGENQTQERVSKLSSLRWTERYERFDLKITHRFDDTSADESALGVADDVNSSRMILIYGADDSSERFHLFPHRSQTVDPVQGIDNSHVRRWVQLADAIGHKIQTGFHIPNAVHDHYRFVRRCRRNETRY